MAPKYILEQFMEAELMINITEHEVVMVTLSVTCFHLVHSLYQNM